MMCNAISLIQQIDEFHCYYECECTINQHDIKFIYYMNNLYIIQNE
jgi:hypothetical protein